MMSILIQMCACINLISSCNGRNDETTPHLYPDRINSLSCCHVGISFQCSNRPLICDEVCSSCCDLLLGTTAAVGDDVGCFRLVDILKSSVRCFWICANRLYFRTREWVQSYCTACSNLTCTELSNNSLQVGDEHPSS